MKKPNIKRFYFRESKQHIYTKMNKKVHKEKLMWNNIKKYLEQYPERLRVARVLVENGLCTKNNKIYLNQIEIPPIRIARTAKVDRRTVNETLKIINANRKLRLIFEELRPAGHSLKRLAKHLDLGVVEITPLDAKKTGILAKAAMILTQNGLSIRQAIVDDPELSPEPKLTLIVEKKIPGKLIPELLNISGVDKVAIY
ncbi:amino acid-binding protein [Candidatus Bathyarchaeota archaeon]|nr:amino acid-binding protein [Candidatus Bathyarchaeota archaeon]